MNVDILIDNKSTPLTHPFMFLFLLKIQAIYPTVSQLYLDASWSPQTQQTFKTNSLSSSSPNSIYSSFSTASSVTLLSTSCSRPNQLDVLIPVLFPPNLAPPVSVISKRTLSSHISQFPMPAHQTRPLVKLFYSSPLERKINLSFRGTL